MPVLSVITVTKDSAHTLRDAIESVCSQKDELIEYIVIDGKSTDQTLSILENYSTCIDRILIEKDDGLYFAMNKGIQLARGRYISFLNADDYYFHNVLSAILEILKSADELSFVSDIQLVDKNQKLHVPVGDLNWRMIPHPGLFMEKSELISLGGFDTNYQVAADYELVSRSMKNGHKIKNINLLTTAHRSGGYSQRRKFRSICETYLVQAKYHKSSIYKNTVLLIKSLFRAWHEE